MAFSPICSVVYALGLVRFISRCYAVPQTSVLYARNRALLVPGLQIPSMLSLVPRFHLENNIFSSQS